MITAIEPPASKSISNRFLILSALSSQTVTINNVAKCDDSTYMINALNELGIDIEQKNNTLHLKNSIFTTKNKQIKKIIYTDNAGTTTRFITALSAIAKQEIEIDGDKRMKERPMKDLIKGLIQLGAKIEHQDFHVPLLISPSELKGTEIKLPGNVSSQFLSALLLIAPFLKGKTIIKITTELCSIPYVNITLKTLETFGIHTTNHEWRKFTTHEQKNNTKNNKLNITVESDASSASYIGAFAAINPSQKILIKNIFKNSIQGDIQFLKYLKKMGCKIEESSKGILIKGPHKLKPLGKIDMNHTPDLVMTFATLAMITPGITHIHNISNLRVKETDRLAALKKEIKKFGIGVETGNDYIKIHGNPDLLSQKKFPHPIQIETYNDHRIAMCFGIFKSKFPELKIKNPDCVSKSYPNFWEDLNALIKNNE